MYLKNVDIGQLEISQLKLPSFEIVELWSVEGVSKLLPLVSCHKLVMWDIDLTTDDTFTLANCLQTNVTKLLLCDGVSLDMSVLFDYEGDGLCNYVRCGFSSCTWYRHQMTFWARKMGWTVSDSGNAYFGGIIIRKC